MIFDDVEELEMLGWGATHEAIEDFQFSQVVRRRAWYSLNTELSKLNSKMWAIRNRERSREIKTRWRLRNVEKAAAASKRWAEQNAEKRKEYKRQWYLKRKAENES